MTKNNRKLSPFLIPFAVLILIILSLFMYNIYILFDTINLLNTTTTINSDDSKVEINVENRDSLYNDTLIILRKKIILIENNNKKLSDSLLKVSTGNKEIKKEEKKIFKKDSIYNSQ